MLKGRQANGKHKCGAGEMAQSVLAMQAEGLSLDSSNPYKTACANPSTPLTRSGARIGESLEEHAAASLVCRVSKGDCKIEGENWHPRRPLDHYSKASVYLHLHS